MVVIHNRSIFAPTNKHHTMATTLSGGETLRMFDHSTKLYIRVCLSDNKKYYEKWVSNNKKDWRLVDKLKSFDEVMSIQQNLIDNNYMNLFNKISNK